MTVLSTRPSALRLALRLVAAAGALFAAAYHGWLLAGRLLDRSLGEPAVAGRWLLSLVLIAWLTALHRRGVPLLWGRRALVFWVAVALVHLPGLAPLGLAAGKPAVSWVSALSATLGVGLALAAWFGTARVVHPVSLLGRVDGEPPACRPDLPRLRRLCGRPPPLLS